MRRDKTKRMNKFSAANSDYIRKTPQKTIINSFYYLQLIKGFFDHITFDLRASLSHYLSSPSQGVQTKNKQFKKNIFFYIC